MEWKYILIGLAVGAALGYMRTKGSQGGSTTMSPNWARS